jgi:16S rRNA (guanine1207-N2)-methyltransferase
MPSAANLPMIAALASPPPALDALMLPFADGRLDWPADDRVLFLRARDGAALRAVLRPGWVCVQGFKPLHDALPTGLMRQAEPPTAERFDVILLLPPRQRAESRAWLARALDGVAPGGVLVVAQSNSEGARTLQDDLARLCGPVQCESRHKCRVIWTRSNPAVIDIALHADWRALDAPRRIAAGYLSRPGLFSWDRVDAGSALLAAHLPADLAGRVADLGAGYGYLSCELLRRCPRVEALDLYEAEAGALPLAQANVEAVMAETGRRPALATHWQDVTAGLGQRYHAIVSNPPFHLDRGDRPDLGLAFIRAAADALHPDGRLLLVANRHLPYEAMLGARFGEWRVRAEGQGYKVIEARRPIR